MEEKGYVVSVYEDFIRIRVDRHSACGGNCVSCKGCPAEAVIIDFKTDDKFNIGDEVILQMLAKNFLKKAFLGYGIPVLLAVIGAILGYLLFKSDGASVLGVFGGIILGVIVVRFFGNIDKKEIILKRKG